MRHKFIYGQTGYSAHGRHRVDSPYTTFGSPHLEYKRPTMLRRYCQILQFVADHPNVKRKEIIAGVFYGKRMRKMFEERLTLTSTDDSYLAKVQAKTRDYLERWDRGDFSWITYNPSRYFAEMLWADLIDYDEKTYRYTITAEGERILKEAYLNDNVKAVTGKFPWQKAVAEKK